MPAHDPQMLKGVLGLLLLSMLSTGDQYGYGIVTQLRVAGFDDLAEGTVYPALTRLEAAGFLESYLLRSDSGPARKYYRLTDTGHAELAHRQTAWNGLVRSVETATAAVSAALTTGETA
ncbi:PadR family transcriptional regulator [Knoellia aerolata]|uniref:PadR family transcriptional regulator n=1 Tax=Knoellia aerolata DSM 18566 TaxID=1385519 RepID=A0A0A0JUP7_9MICO|nr:PadR family transcriptional regulator [Knoellia aerolata]KGN41095.1 PadR family transcriptional regulator [Knoellia aerolata DSM 18566]